MWWYLYDGCWSRMMMMMMTLKVVVVEMSECVLVVVESVPWNIRWNALHVVVVVVVVSEYMESRGVSYLQ